MIRRFFERHKNLVSFASLLLTSTVLMIGGPLKAFQYVKGLFQLILLPFVFMFSLSYNVIRTNIRNLNNLAYYQDRLKKTQLRLLEQAQQLAELNQLQAENQTLRRILQNVKKITYKRILVADVVYKKPNNWSVGITIDRGHVHGIKRDDPVIAFSFQEDKMQKGVVGRVDQVWPLTSTIVPIVEKNASIFGHLAQQKLKGEIRGIHYQRDRVLTMKIFSKEAVNIKQGEQVSTSSESTIYPPFLGIGHVLDFDLSNPRYILLRLKPVINFEKLETVYIYLQR